MKIILGQIVTAPSPGAHKAGYATSSSQARRAGKGAWASGQTSRYLLLNHYFSRMFEKEPGSFLFFFGNFFFKVTFDLNVVGHSWNGEMGSSLDHR